MSKLIRIDIPEPKMGAKVYLLETKGTYTFEEGPATLRGICCTHAGSGAITFFDGVPDENGFFPDEGMEESHPLYNQRNGRPVFRANPVIMGMFMLDSGLMHGLTVKVEGGHDATCAILTLTWMKYKQR